MRMVVSLRKLYCIWSSFFDFYASVFRLINNFLVLCLGSRFFTVRNQKFEMNFYSREESFKQLIVSRSEVSALGELAMVKQLGVDMNELACLYTGNRKIARGMENIWLTQTLELATQQM